MKCTVKEFYNSTEVNLDWKFKQRNKAVVLKVQPLSNLGYPQVPTQKMLDDMIRFWTSVVPATTERMEFMKELEIKSNMQHTLAEIQMNESLTNKYFDQVRKFIISLTYLQIAESWRKPLHNSPEMVQPYDIVAIDGEANTQRYIWFGIVMANLVSQQTLELIWFHKVEEDFGKVNYQVVGFSKTENSHPRGNVPTGKNAKKSQVKSKCTKRKGMLEKSKSNTR